MESNSALHCIRLIKYYFTTDELKQLLTANFYSILYYNSEMEFTNPEPVIKTKNVVCLGKCPQSYYK